MMDINWYLLTVAIRIAAQVELKVSKDEDTGVQTYEARRHTLDPEWRKQHYTYRLLETIPKEVLEAEVHKMIKELYQPIIDLDWENYLWPHVEVVYGYGETRLVPSVTSQEYLGSPYGFMRGLVEADPEMYRPMVQQTPQSFIYLKDNHGIDGDAT